MTAKPGMDWTITLTFGEGANSYFRMQHVGELWSRGLNMKELKALKRAYDEAGYTTELHDLVEYLNPDITEDNVQDAGVLVVRGGLRAVCDPDELYVEQRALDHDKKVKMFGGVKNKKARYNLCFSDEGQEPDYEAGISRVVPYESVPLTTKLRDYLCAQCDLFEGMNMQCEGNYYYAPSCGIGYHGDTQRKVVLGVRLGGSMSLCYEWYKNSQRCGERAELMLHHGDLFFMTEKASGFDWKKRSRYTLRHAAGSGKYTQ